MPVGSRVFPSLPSTAVPTGSVFLPAGPGRVDVAGGTSPRRFRRARAAPTRPDGADVAFHLGTAVELALVDFVGTAYSGAGAVVSEGAVRFSFDRVLKEYTSRSSLSSLSSFILIHHVQL